MRVLFVLILIVVSLVKYIEKNPDKAEKNHAEKQRSVPKTSEETSPIRTVREKKRAQLRHAEQWAAAKHQQDDAEQVHSIAMDSCESKLQNLRVLYEAGILDREEYVQRVARVKANHARG